MIQLLLAGMASVVILAVAALAARRGTTTTRGVLLGILTGVCAATVLGFAGAFLSYLVPLGQLEFWFASLLARP